MRLGSIGRVEEVNISDLYSHAYCCVCGNEVLVFNDFDLHSHLLGPIRRNSVSENCFKDNWLYNTTVRPDCAPGCSSEHFQSFFEPQSDQRHANENA
jgi:hypothetical protein